MFRRRPLTEKLPPLPSRFGVRSREQVVRDFRTVASHLLPRDRYIVGLGSAGLLRPSLSLPAYAGLIPSSGTSPVYNFFDRTGGGRRWRAAVTRRAQRDWRGGALSYDEHAGTDFVCPPGTPVVAAAPGVLVAVRDNWLRGGLTACVDHGSGVVTQYTHLTSLVAEVGRPVARGEVIALSGVSGLDIAQFFPWVPPHLHFMVWIDGTPVDPYVARGEAAHRGAWLHANDPRAARGPVEGDPSPSKVRVEVNAAAIERVTSRCLDPRVRAEIEGAPSDGARAAILEDSYHHDAPAWPDDVRGTAVRTHGEPARVPLTLPLTAELYSNALAADTPWTRPQ